MNHDPGTSSHDVETLILRMFASPDAVSASLVDIRTAADGPGGMIPRIRLQDRVCQQASMISGLVRG